MLSSVMLYHVVIARNSLSRAKRFSIWRYYYRSSWFVALDLDAASFRGITGIAPRAYAP